MSWRPCLSLTQVAEIHRASKDGQLYIGGAAGSCTEPAQPPEPTEYDIPPASLVYSVSSVPPSSPDLGLEKASRPLSSARARPLALSGPRSPGPGCPAADPPAFLCSPHSSPVLGPTLSPQCPAGSPSAPPESPAAQPSGPARECAQNLSLLHSPNPGGWELVSPEAPAHSRRPLS